MNTTSLLRIAVFVAFLILIVIVLYRSNNESFTIVESSSRPPLGDYLPVVGQYPVGEDSRLYESDF